MIKWLNRNILILIAIIFFAQTNSIAQNTPSKVTHLLSISDGISAPFRIAVKSDGTIYVTDVKQQNIVVFDQSYNLTKTINVGIKPTAIAINSSDEVFVGDSETGIIYKLDLSDNFVEFSNIVNSASCMVFDNNDSLYVVDGKLKQLTVLDINGDYVRAIGAGSFVQPTGIAYDSINDRILVSEHGGIGPDVGGGMMGGGYPLTKVWIFDTNGIELGEIGEGGGDDGQFYRIQGMTTSQNGVVYVTDPYQGRISLFEENGVFLNNFGEYGSVSGKLNIPMDVKFDSQGRTLVSSMNTGTIEVYYVNEINPTYKITTNDEIICTGENTDISVDFTGTAPWTFTYTRDGLNPVTITDTNDDPYTFNTSEPGLFEITSLSDANYDALDYSNKVAVTQNPFPTSEITSGDVEICTGTNTDVAISFTGVAPYTFTYTDGTTPVTIYNNELNPYIISTEENGTYEVTSLIGGECVGSSLTGTANINVNALPSSVINSNDIVICEGETTDISIDLTGTAPWTFTYSINGIDQTSIITSTNPHLLTTGTEGIYAITALSDASSTGECFTGYTTISVTPLPTSNISSDDVTICEGESTNINIELTGTAPWDLTYTIDGLNPVIISDISTSPYILTVQEAGLYEITEVIGNNCSGVNFTGSTEVTVNSLPTSVIAEGNDQYYINEGDSYDFSLELTGESPWTYTYVIDDQNPIIVSTSNSTNTITGSVEGTYEVREVSDLNCTNDKSEGYPEIVFDPTPSSLISEGNMTICEGSFADIQIDLTGTAPWSITYTKNGLNPVEVIANTSPYTLSVSEAGLYKVSELTDAILTGTRLIGEAIISINPKPTSTLQNSSIAFCVGESSSIPIELTGTAPWTFAYTIDDLTTTSISTSDNSYLLNVSQSGVYKIISISDANCTGTSTTGISDVSINPLPNVNLGTDVSICEGETTTLNAGVFISYLWSDGSTTQTIDVNSAGTFNVSVTDAHTCENTDEIIVSVNPLPISDFTYTENNLEVSFVNSSLNTNSYLWSFGDSNTSIEINPIHTYQSSGNYDVTLTASNNECGNSVNIKSVNAISTSNEDIGFEKGIKVYPNPSDGLLTIEFVKIELLEFELEIINIAGQRVFHKEIESMQSIEKIDLRSLAKGIYTLNLISKDWTKTQRIILSQ